MRRVPDKLKSIFQDSVWSITGLVLMNVAAQFVVFPCWNRVLGSEAYGNIVYLLGIMNILAISVGSGVNYARMRKSSEGETANRPYNILMAAGSGLSLVVLLVLKASGLLQIGPVDFILFCILTIVTMWRFYADVEYRLHINYKGYFLYYLIIGLGYLAGVFLFKFTGCWPLALLPGEIAGLLLVLWKGSVFKKDVAAGSSAFPPILQLAALLVGINVLSSLIFNGDRILLNFAAGSAAVSVFYIASLFGKTMTLITTPLNGVLVGHLAKYEGSLTARQMNQIAAMTAAGAVLATVVCVVASMLILPLLYPADYEAVRGYLILANTAQVIYFTGNVLTTSILLRFTSARNQMLVPLVYGTLFLLVCIPATLKFGIRGFCWGLLIVNMIRYFYCLLLGYRGAKRI